ncbi:hypothetical protein F0P96_15505 [Hymenobacter busanensis]|uniref:Uncharacterized protein n=1 Tax=Hymenobacter busanensis TaxID=2607656 RepID=A0A7L4ZZV1_9BACT|nr:hypothetical protein [Hymenobacter busanensis]KAA9331637.1 hypothetical protein F0P96_15505 [Hymenobacter busanensis]QHJ08788.1 hypothetical protein GUY19_16440 [Hymenobacter busanensis]
MRFSLLSFACLTLVSVAQAQQLPAGYTEGYIIDNAGTKVTGLVENTRWQQNPRQVYFKTAPDAQPVVYRVGQVVEFRTVEGEFYRRRGVTVDVAENRPGFMDVNAPPSQIERDSVWLDVYAEGKLTLYYLRDARNKDHFYLEKADQGPAEMVVNRSLREINGRRVQAEDNTTYKRILQEFTADCAQASTRAAQTPFEARALQKLVQYYNEWCGTQSATTYVRSADTYRTRVKVGATVGGGLTRLGFSTNPNFKNAYENLASIHPTGLTPVGGLGLYVQPTRRRNQVYRIELQYQRLRADADVSYFVGVDDRLYARHEQLSLSVGYRQLLGSSVTQPFWGVGAGLASLFRRSYTVEYIDSRQKRSVTLLGAPAVLAPAAQLEIGVQRGNFALSLRGEYVYPKQDLLPPPTYRSTAFTTGLLVTAFFK